mmetsp:Transcript_12460/g.18807  ORF Transcript_12460/g.18807 Transcript_12460/m.18807 type:complete len:193 (-) Transcript_12460:141-719(-)
MATSSHKKRSRGSYSGDGSSSSYLSSLPSSVNIMPSPTENEEEYERAVAFLRNFHSTRVAALSPTSRSPLGAISEIGIGDLVNDFSLALQVESSSKTIKAGPSPLSPSRSPRIKKTTTSTCLLDLATTSSSGSTNSNSSANEKEVNDSSLFSLHQQARDEIFESCSTSSDFGVGYCGLNGLGNKRHCSSRIR